MKFGLSFTRKFRERLETKARNFGETDDGNVVVQESNVSRMYMMDGYEQSAFADNESIFHGREVRKVSTFGEKSGMMIQLSLANEDDDEGWTKEEIEEYSGWLSDQQRKWRDGDALESEGVAQDMNSRRDGLGAKSALRWW
jgi:hypothetical protein